MRETEIINNFDHQRLGKLYESLMKLGNKSVSVGITASANQSIEEGELNLAGLLAIHEFGTLNGNIPERAALRTSVIKSVDAYIDFNKVNFKRVLREQISVDDALNLLGIKAASDVQNGIGNRTLELTPNKPSTIKSKGSDTPLIDTGQLRQSITHEIRET